MGEDPSSHYALANNIDAGETADWSGGGFKPIGDNPSRPLSGTFNGKNYDIKDLYIDRPSQSYIGGLFCYNVGKIKNVSLTNATITGNISVGGLVAVNNGEVESSQLKGDISGKGHIGGLVGFNYGKVKSSYVIGDVLGEGRQGALVGDNRNQISLSYAIGDFNQLDGANNTLGGINTSFIFLI